MAMCTRRCRISCCRVGAINLWGLRNGNLLGCVGVIILGLYANDIVCVRVGNGWGAASYTPTQDSPVHQSTHALAHTRTHTHTYIHTHTHIYIIYTHTAPQLTWKHVQMVMVSGTKYVGCMMASTGSSITVWSFEKTYSRRSYRGVWGGGCG